MIDNVSVVLMRADKPQINMFGDNPIFAETRAIKKLKANIRAKLQSFVQKDKTNFSNYCLCYE